MVQGRVGDSVTSFKSEIPQALSSLSEDINEVMTSATNQWQPKVIIHITAAKQHPDVGTGSTNSSKKMSQMAALGE